MVERRLDPEHLPRHVAIIMDGNGRWAEERGLSRIEGHREGIESVRAVLRAAHELGIGTLTLYAFSLENWNRPRDEVGELMGLLERYLEEELDEVMRNGIRVRAVGRLELLPPSVREQLDRALAKTRDNDEMQLVFALSYGGRQEIVDGVRKLLRDVEQGKASADHIDEKAFSAYLYDPEVPDPDLLIRTGGESRVSNFLLWQIAYTEIHVTERMWPDFRKGDLVDAILDFQSRERRFGMTSAQVQGSK